MSRVAYVNGRYVPHRKASVHVEDRGYQFADGVYEVVLARGGRLIDEPAHLDRLQRSLDRLAIAMPLARAALGRVLHETLRRNLVADGIVYLQATRGVARRDHGFPDAVRPSLVATARRMAGPAARLLEQGADVVSLPDIRWQRCDIKAVALLPNVLAKQQARAAGAYEALQVDADGRVTEGTSTNAWIVDADGSLVTRPADRAILNGITRLRLIDLARRAGYRVEERAFTLAEAKRAREAFLTSTTSFVLPVTRIDGDSVANGRPGSVTLGLLALYRQFLDGELQGGPLNLQD